MIPYIWQKKKSPKKRYDEGLTPKNRLKMLKFKSGYMVQL
jgi:phage terminase large subunit-like protein